MIIEKYFKSAVNKNDTPCMSISVQLSVKKLCDKMVTERVCSDINAAIN